MAEDFSFATDIAPLEQKFFGGNSRSLSRAQRSSFVSGALDERLRLAGEAAKIDEQKASMRARDLQYESSLLALERERERAASERAILAELPALQSELESIVSDTDEVRKQQRLSSFGVRRAAQIATNPIAEQAFRAASYGVNRGSQMRPSITVGDLVAKGIPIDKIATPGAKVDDPVDPFKASAAITSANEERAKASVSLAEQEAKLETDKQEQTARVKDWKEASDTIMKLDSMAEHPVVDFAAVSAIRRFGSEEDMTAFNAIDAELALLDQQEASGVDKKEIGGKRSDAISRKKQLALRVLKNNDPAAAVRKEAASSNAQKAWSLFAQ